MAEKQQKSPINKENKQQKAGAYVFFQIKPFKDNELWVNHWDTVLTNLSSLWSKKIQFWIIGNHTDIKMYAKVPGVFKTYFMNTFFSNFPTSDLVEIENPSTHPLVTTVNKPQYTNRQYLYFKPKAPMQSKASFTKDGTYMDPIRDIFALYNNIEKNSLLDIQFTYFYKKKKSLGQKIWSFAKKFLLKSKPLDHSEAENDYDKEKSREEIYASIGYIVKTTDQYTAQAVHTNILSSFSSFCPTGAVQSKNKASFKDMNIDQAVNFFHIPSKLNYFKGLDYVMYRKLPYPNTLPTPNNTPAEELTLLGKTDYRGEEIPFGIKTEDKFRHMYIIGKTGTGKTTFISNMIKSDMEKWKGLALLDPHGDLVDKVIEFVPNNRINDVVLFDVSDSDFPIGFNLLQHSSEEEKVRIVSWVVTAFHKMFEHSRWPRLEYILRNVLLSIVDYPNATIMHILRVLTDKEFRNEVIRHIKDPMVLRFWTNEFLKRNDKQREDAVWPIANKIGQFLSSKIVRNIFGQPRTKLSLRQAMDEGKIVLVNLSKGKIGEDNASMIGSLLVTKFQIDAMSRADIPEHERREFYLYIDEFQNFATKSFATILSEARKYKLSLIVANQFTAQIMDDVRNAIFGNVGSILSLTLWHDDAQVISSQFKETITPNDAISIPKLQWYLRMMIDGHTWDPFSVKFTRSETPEDSVEKIEKIRKQSRQRYAIEKERLERLMDARNKKTFSQQEKVAEKAKREGRGVTEQEYTNLQNEEVQANIAYFSQRKINDTQADAIIFDTENAYHKAVFFEQPAKIDEVADLKIKAGSQVAKKSGGTLNIYVDMYRHKYRENDHQKPIMLRVWSKSDILKQLKEWYGEAKNLLYVPNIEKLEEQYSSSDDKQNVSNLWSKETMWWWASEGFSVHDIKLNERYEGYVKIVYNYGIFVTVKGVEWLLHKNYIVTPAGVERKKYFNVWDKIKVKAKEFKDIKWEKKVVRSMK